MIGEFFIAKKQQIKGSDYFRQQAVGATNFTSSNWAILTPVEAQIKRKIEARGVPLKKWNIQINRGILTGYNKAFIIDSTTKDTLIAKSPKNAEIIRPILKGRHIKKYVYEFDDLWLIFTRRGININEYPTVREYLQTHYEQLKPRVQSDIEGRKPGQYKWYEIQDNVAYYRDFLKEKIIWLELTDIPKFAYDVDGYLIEATAFILTGERLKFLTAFLNSKLCEWYFDKITTTSGVGTNRWKKVYLEALPVPKPSAQEDTLFSSYLDEILDRKRAGLATKEIEQKVDHALFQLFDLTDLEIAIIMN